MIKTVSVLSFAVLVALIVVSFSGSQKFGDVAARERGADTCRIQEVALDEGYGVTRTVASRVCAD